MMRRNPQPGYIVAVSDDAPVATTTDTSTAATSSSSDATATPAASISDLVDSDGAKMTGAALMAYHGYKRSSGSILWTAFYGFMGHWKPQYAVPVALAQGFGRRKVCTTVDD